MNEDDNTQFGPDTLWELTPLGREMAEEIAREKAAWMQFACAAISAAMDLDDTRGRWTNVSRYAADFADAMVKEAKERGRL